MFKMHNKLEQYINCLSEEVAEQLYRPSLEATEIMEDHLWIFLEELPDKNIGSDRDTLKLILTNAMLSGYLLKSAETRMQIQKSIDY
ncbi:MAG: DUF760 domain-containing protein [Prochloraceae cyanobacterium]|nr:DUF760 domain-containing protein [Prochloraceae cyanobacterium]